MGSDEGSDEGWGEGSAKCSFCAGLRRLEEAPVADRLGKEGRNALNEAKEKILKRRR